MYKIDKKELNFWIWVVILVAMILGYLNVPSNIAQKIIGFIVLGPLIGIFTSYYSASLVESLTNDSLKNIFIVKEICGYEFSMSIFTVVTFIVEVLIFYN